MRIHVDAGHGEGYRSTGHFDYGYFADNGDTEAAICREYARRLRVLVEERGLKSTITISGSIATRLTQATARQADLLVSLHMDADVSAKPGGRVLYATAGSALHAYTIGTALGLPVEQAAPVGTLLFNSSVEIRLGNIVSWDDMKRLAAGETREKVCNAILDAILPLSS